MENKTFQLRSLNFILSFLSSGFLAILYVRFFKQFITLPEIFLAEALGAGLVVVYTTLRGVFFARRDMQMGFLLIGAGLILLLFPFSLSIFFGYTILRAVGNIIFYIPYNINFFRRPAGNKNLWFMTYYWAVSSLAVIIGPLVGGFCLEKFGMNIFLIFAFFCVAVGVYLSSFTTEEPFRYSTREVLRAIKGLRTINVIDGALHRVIAIITIISVVYIKSEFDYGKFLSFIAIIALCVSFYMAKVSDRSGRRMRLIVPFSILAGGVCILFFWSASFTSFLVLILLLKSITVLVEPARSNIMQDVRKPAPLNWIARELYINVGRAGIFGVAFLIFQFSNGKIIYIILGLLHLLFPLVVAYKKIYPLPVVEQTV